jgi:hypothetical protein
MTECYFCELPHRWFGWGKDGTQIPVCAIHRKEHATLFDRVTTGWPCHYCEKDPTEVGRRIDDTAIPLCAVHRVIAAHGCTEFLPIGEFFHCDVCGEHFPRGWTDEEAEAESVLIHGRTIPEDERATVCDECWQTGTRLGLPGTHLQGGGSA